MASQARAPAAAPWRSCVGAVTNEPGSPSTVLAACCARLSCSRARLCWGSWAACRARQGVRNGRYGVDLAGGVCGAACLAALWQCFSTADSTTAYCLPGYSTQRLILAGCYGGASIACNLYQWLPYVSTGCDRAPAAHNAGEMCHRQDQQRLHFSSCCRNY
jgi:hypothetical protein